jgi:hypothetical protein
LFRGSALCYNKGRQKPPFTIVEKAACRFFEENSLRFVPCHPQGGCDTRSAQSVFCHARVAAENGFELIACRARHATL